MHPAHIQILKYFDYLHLRENLQVVAKPFYELAHDVASSLANVYDHYEVTHCLRKLLEAKDCAVRAALNK